MDEAELKQRTKQFALRVIKLAGSLPGNFIARIISSQLVRAGTSVGANYRAAAERTIPSRIHCQAGYSRGRS